MNKLLIMASSLAVFIVFMIHNSAKVGKFNHVLNIKSQVEESVVETSSTTDSEENYLTGLNDAEFELALQHPSAAMKVKECTNKALLKTNELFTGKSSVKGDGDAFRHCYWNILMVKAIGVELAEAFATAHEADSPDGPDKEMDLYNNRLARQWATRMLNKTDDEIVNDVLKRVEYGELLKIERQPNGVEVLVHTTGEGRIEN